MRLKAIISYTQFISLHRLTLDSCVLLDDISLSFTVDLVCVDRFEGSKLIIDTW